ncbi:hypothetical protein BDR06DRAFT_1054969 [Suillus hirtellus]|nr:hypothetical protein BDR06DRAFT_1054969 [Suillus hirtellus]
MDEIKHLSSEEAGWHFGALHVTTKQLEAFSVDDMAIDMASCAPALWDLLGFLLGADCHPAMLENNLEDADGDTMMGGELAVNSMSTAVDDSYWDTVDAIDLEGFVEGLTSASSGTVALELDKRQSRCTAIIAIKCVVILSILMQGMNQKSNALQSILGIFLQSVHAPQKVIDTLSRIGISISCNTINAAIRSLSAESQNTLHALGQSMLACYAYDNFDVDLKSQVPLAKKSNDTLKHLTSGLLFPLQHGITLNDLKYSEALWRQSMLNPDADSFLLPKRSWKDLLSIHPEVMPQSTPMGLLLSRHDRFNAWVFLSDLCNHGPVYFRRFQSMIPDPESIDKIPLVQTPLTAARAMDINNSTVTGNIQAVVSLLAQGGVHDPADTNLNSPDISQHVVLFHGDLGTGERLQAAQLQRSIEATPWNHLQHVIFIPSLFHLKMACIDAIWRLFLQPLTAREDETSLMRDVTHLRPKETGIYCSKPGFRRMHQLVGHAGICRRLDCWRVYVKSKNPNYMSLDAFAASEPTINILQDIANELAKLYVAGHDLYQMRCQPHERRDVQYENALILNEYFLLYEELSYAMNHGDIGCIETCIIPWIPILKATGKHKWAVRYHILVNPSSKETKW